jgi:hypothetical protein
MTVDEASEWRQLLPLSRFLRVGNEEAISFDWYMRPSFQYSAAFIQGAPMPPLTADIQ